MASAPMKSLRPLRTILFLLFLSLLSSPASGHEGHDHGAPSLAPSGAPGASSGASTVVLHPLWMILPLLLFHSLSIFFQVSAHEGRHDHDTDTGAPAPAPDGASASTSPSSSSTPSSPSSSMASSPPIKALSPIWEILPLLFPFFQANTRGCRRDHDTYTDAPSSPSSSKSSASLGPQWKTLLFLLFLFLLSSQVRAHGGHDGDAGGDGQVNLRSRGLIAVKIWCLVILLASTFAGGVSPYFFRWNESFLLMGTQFAGGVFLGTSLMHFLADANSTFLDRTSKTYPFAFMLASVGYLLTMFGDCIIVAVTEGARKEARVEVEEEHGGETRLDHHPAFVKTTSLGDTLLLILALCFHSVFEGIAIGVAGIHVI